MLSLHRKGHLRQRDGRRVVQDSRLREQQCQGTEERNSPEFSMVEVCAGREGGGEGEEVIWAHDTKLCKVHFRRRWNCLEGSSSC